MASQRAAGQRFRQRKLSTKQNLAILRENEVEAIFDDEAQRNIPRVETGVEKAEEVEHHLQAVISSQAAGSGNSAYIPTPPANLSGVQYERLYSPRYQHPSSYIRFSSTVEDCIGSAYCMNDVDEKYLRHMNKTYKSLANKPSVQCTEDQFEEVMSFFEETCSLKQPYASLDNTPILPYAEMESSFDETIVESCRIFAKDIYEHWKAERIARQNHPLMPALKFERNADTDEADPFVCFRRREVRQARKTRGRDAQVTEKLKKMRQELEQARQLMHLTKQRELARRDQIVLDRQIFRQRCAIKEIKRGLSIKGDDQDLFNQKPVDKTPKMDLSDRRGSGMHLKASLRPEGRLQDHDLTILADERKKRETEVEAVIQESMVKHRNWNNGWIDNTWRPITPPLESASRSSFRTAFTEALPTPPPSATSDHGIDEVKVDSNRKREQVPPFRYGSPPLEHPSPRPAFRRRIGRGGRLWIDRRNLSSPDMSFDLQNEDTLRQLELQEYDIESDEDTEVYHNDPYTDWNMRCRINYSVMPTTRDPDTQRRMQQEQQKRLQAASTERNAATNGTSTLAVPQQVAKISLAPK